MKERVQKIIAASGTISRRDAEELIKNGKVRVNGKKITIGDMADSRTDTITVSGRDLERTRRKYLLLNKPRGFITTRSDLYDRKTVMDLVPPDYQDCYPVGRLDRDAEGLLLLTNDGELANKVLHPRYRVKKTYRVWLDRPFKDREFLEKGVRLKDGFVKNIRIFPVRKDCVDIRLHIGKNKIVKRIFKTCGYYVKRLKRIKIGKLELGHLKPGQVQVVDHKLLEDKILL